MDGTVMREVLRSLEWEANATSAASLWAMLAAKITRGERYRADYFSRAPNPYGSEGYVLQGSQSRSPRHSPSHPHPHRLRSRRPGTALIAWVSARGASLVWIRYHGPGGGGHLAGVGAELAEPKCTPTVALPPIALLEGATNATLPARHSSTLGSMRAPHGRSTTSFSTCVTCQTGRTTGALCLSRSAARSAAHSRTVSVVLMQRQAGVEVVEHLDGVRVHAASEGTAWGRLGGVLLRGGLLCHRGRSGRRRVRNRRCRHLGA